MLKNIDRRSSQRKSDRDAYNSAVGETDAPAFGVDSFVDPLHFNDILQNVGIGTQPDGQTFHEDARASSSFVAPKLGASDPQAEPSPSSAQAEPSPISGSAASESTVVIAEGATAEISGDVSQAVTFSGTTGTLKIDHSTTFTGEITGLSGVDALDLADIKFGAKTQGEPEEPRS